MYPISSLFSNVNTKTKVKNSRITKLKRNIQHDDFY